MEQREYSASAVKWSFWFMEFKKVVNLLYDGLTIEEIRKKNQEENLFAASSSDRATMILNTVAARINAMPDGFSSQFVAADVTTQKLYCLIGCMCYDRLFFEFVYEVVREKMIIGTNAYTDSDLRIFFADKQRQSDKAAKWTDYTLKRLGTCYKTMLYEAGLTDKGKMERQIFRPILYPEMQMWLNDSSLVPIRKALEGVA